MISEYLGYVLNNLYLRFVLVLIITLIVAFFTKIVVKRVLKPLTRRTKTKIDDLLVASLSSVVFYLVLAIGFKIGFQHFDFESSVLNSVIDTLLIVIVAVILMRIIVNFSRHWKEEWAAKTESTADDRFIPLLEKILGAVVVILGVFFVLDAWNVNITPLLGTAGLAGIALSFAVNDSLANIFGGIQLVIDKTFKVGDKIQLESGQLGVILDIGLRSTKLKT